MEGSGSQHKDRQTLSGTHDFKELFSFQNFEITMISAVLLTGKSFELNSLVIQIKN